MYAPIRTLPVSAVAQVGAYAPVRTLPMSFVASLGEEAPKLILPVSRLAFWVRNSTNRHGVRDLSVSSQTNKCELLRNY